MTNEQQFFLQVLFDHLNNRKTAIPRELDWNIIIEFAESHQLSGILFHQCKDCISPEIAKKFSVQYARDTFYYANRVAMLTQVQKAFAVEQIDFVTVKGTEVSKYYPIPALRTMSDCDVVVRKEDAKRAAQLFERLGFENTSVSSAHELNFIKDKIGFELHSALLYEEPAITKGHADFFNNFWIYCAEGNLDDSFHFLFLLEHLRKHLLNSGVGFRQFMDLAVEVKNNNRLDWGFIEKTLADLSNLEFSKRCFWLIEKWFGITTPLETDEYDDFFEFATERVFRNGVFGFDNEENKDNKSMLRFVRPIVFQE